MVRASRFRMAGGDAFSASVAVEVATRQVSLATKIKQVTGLAGTIRVGAETNEFLQDIEDITADGQFTKGLTPAQIQWIEAIWQEHFA